MMMARIQEVEEVKKWEELLNDSKTVTDSKAVEFSLAKADTHEEYWLFLNIDKHTGDEQCKGNCDVKLNGAYIGYYTLSYDLSIPRNVTYHILMEPLNLLELTASTNGLPFNCISVLREEAVGTETGTGKFVLTFPANYTGKVTARVLGRQELTRK